MKWIFIILAHVPFALFIVAAIMLQKQRDAQLLRSLGHDADVRNFWRKQAGLDHDCFANHQDTKAPR